MSIEFNQEWYHVVRQYVDSAIDDLGVSMPGNVVSYDRSAQTARVRPATTRRLVSFSDPDDIIFEDRPDLFNVPVVWPGGDAGGTGSSYFHPGLEAGEGVLIICSDADFAQWRKTSRKTNPRNESTHRYASAVCLPGLRPRPQKLPDNEVILAVGGVTRSVAVANPLDQLFEFFQQNLLAQAAALAGDPSAAAAVTAVANSLAAARTNPLADFFSPYIKTGGL